MDFLDKIGDLGNSNEVLKGDTVITVGESMSDHPEVLFVEKGILMRKGVKSGKKNIHGLLTAGDICNPELVFSLSHEHDVYEREVSVPSKLGNALVRKVELSELKILMSQDHMLSDMMVSYIGKHLMRAEQQLENMVFLDSRSRIIETIANLADTFGKSVGTETLIPMQLTQQDIAELSGSSRQTVNTLLGELKQENIISTASRGKILIRDLESFRTLQV